MTKKAEIPTKWLTATMALYDANDEQGRRDLFRRTCKTASSRFTAVELDQAMRDMQYWLDKEGS